jgi:hypothetical protein
MNIERIDKVRFQQEWAADQDVLARLAEQGDRVDQIRNIDVSFIGNRSDVGSAEKLASEQDFQTVQLIELEDGGFRLDVSRVQDARPDSIKALTITALQIEAAAGVFYDGWGCVAQNDKS